VLVDILDLPMPAQFVLVINILLALDELSRSASPSWSKALAWRFSYCFP
jgi:hypothetical protein